MNWYLKVLQNYSTFEGRARRSEYWYFILVNFIISFILQIMEVSMEMDMPLSAIYSVVTLIPGLAVSVRRMHDIGKSGWMILIVLIPIIGLIWYLVLAATDSNPGKNKYGPNPKK